jgi:hypothetical protein
MWTLHAMASKPQPDDQRQDQMQLGTKKQRQQDCKLVGHYILELQPLTHSTLHVDQHNPQTNKCHAQWAKQIQFIHVMSN